MKNPDHPATTHSRSIDMKEQIAEFADALVQMRHDAGRPSYGEIARLSRGITPVGVTKTTVHRAFGGEHLPKWNTVEAILRSCGVPEESVRSWRVRWVTLSKALDNISGSASPSGPKEPEGPPSACAECGSLVLDQRLHEQWHQDYVKRPARRLRAVGHDDRPPP